LAVLIVDLLTNASSNDMTRYYVLAMAIVVLVGSIIVAHRLPAPDLRISAEATGTPSAGTVVPSEPPRSPLPFAGEGSWVLSALPGCFDERSRVRGPVTALVAKLPPPATRIQPPARLRVGPCTVLVRPHDLWVFRGPDRLRVPPEAALYRVDGRLTLVVRSGGAVEIRRY
jgi:hypothetical protein